MKTSLFFIVILSSFVYSSEYIKKIDLNFLNDCSFCEDRNLVFTAPDMNKDGQNPDTSFSGVYAGSNFRIQAWRMKPSSEGQQEISLMFGVPSDFNELCPFEITFYLFAQKNSGSQGDTANIRIQSDHKGAYQEIGPNYSSVNSTGNFTIIEASTNFTLESIIITTTLTATGINPQDWILFVFDRIAPAGDAQEYSKNIYLAGVDIKYGAKW